MRILIVTTNPSKAAYFEALLADADAVFVTPCAARREGWPLDSLTYYADLGKYRAELTPVEMMAVRYETDKAAESDHRAMLRWLHEGIRQYCK